MLILFRLKVLEPGISNDQIGKASNIFAHWADLYMNCLLKQKKDLLIQLIIITTVNYELFIHIWFIRCTNFFVVLIASLCMAYP